MKNAFGYLIVFGLVAVGLIGLRDGLPQPTAAAEKPVGKTATVAAVHKNGLNTDPAAAGRTAYLRMEADGHYWTTAYINKQPIRFMVDTGASMIALTRNDARKLGIDPANLQRDVQLSTANGVVQAPSLVLDEVIIDRVKATGVDAVVIEEGLSHSLLGMSFLSQMRQWEATPRAIIIRQ